MTDTIKLRGIEVEDFCNYKKPAMFIITSYCDFKCCHEGGFPEEWCQNEPLIKNTTPRDISLNKIIKAYMNNEITEAVVFGGMEPMLQFEEVLSFIDYLRRLDCEDPVIIYTGYYKDEIADQVEQLKQYKNVIIKYGRYIPNDDPHLDEVLGVVLASNNQYAERIS